MPLDIAALRSQRPQTEFHYFATVDSTMREASQLASANAPNGTVVLADEQTAGVGRLGRSWVSQANAGIYCSMLLRFPPPLNRSPVVALMLGLATAAAIEKTTDLACDLRWPNDVLIDGRKTAGMLAQLIDDCIVAGIGINVNQTRMPEGLRTPATSLRMASGRLQSREALLLVLLESIDSFSEMLAADGAAAIVRAFTAASSYAADRRVVLDETGQHGATAGLDESGFLLVRFDSGKLERIAAGGVRPEP